MRIFLVTSYYPPERVGGNEIGCQDLVLALRARGHQVRVLAGALSAVKGSSEGQDSGIWRRLKAGSKRTSDWRGVLLKEWTNQKVFRALVRDFLPHLVLFFDLSEVSFSLVWLAKKMGFPLCFYLADNWFAIWEKDPWRQLWPAQPRGFKMLRWLSRRFELVTPEEDFFFSPAIFASSHLKSLARTLGRTSEDAPIIPWGVDLHIFSPSERPRPRPSRLLYVGQLMPHKGLDVVIKALEKLKQRLNELDLTLTVVEIRKDKGGPNYRRYFYELARVSGIENIVRFEKPRSRSEMAELYRSHDIMIFPPAGDDSLSLRLLEAMACGLAIVSTPTSGNADVLKDGKNALFFPAENAERCAAEVERLLKEPGLYETIASGARKTAEQSFGQEDVVLAIERELGKVARQGEAHVLQEKTFSPADLARDSRCLRRWLFLATLAVTARALLKPAFYARILRKSFDKGTSLVALLLFPPLLEAFFKLAGRRRLTFRVGMDSLNWLRNVMVVQLADMGDVLLSGPFLRELRLFAARARIVLVIQPSMANLVENCPYIDEIVFFPWRKARNWRNAFSGSLRWWFQAIWITVRRLWKSPLDMAFSLRWNNDPCQAASLILMLASSAAERIGYQDYPHHLTGYKLTDVNRLITRGPVRGFPEQEIERQLELFSFLGLKPERAGAKMELWTNQEDETFASAILARSKFPKDGLLVAFAPGAAWEFRRWPVERFIELGRWLEESHGAFILIFAASNERSLALQLEKGLNPHQTLNLAGQTTIRQMGSLLRSCRLFVGNDSGPMHVAVAAGIPVVGLFGPGEYERFRPWGSDHEVVRLSFPCSPCSQQCFFESARCIRGISVDQVKEVVRRKLNFS